MSFIEWITRRPGFRSLEDSFAINRASMLTGLRRAVVQQQKRCDEVWLVAHFFDTFVVLQDYLGREKIDYQIVDRSFEGSNFPIREDGKAGTVRLALASLIVIAQVKNRPEVQTRPSVLTWRSWFARDIQTTDATNSCTTP